MDRNVQHYSHHVVPPSECNCFSQDFQSSGNTIYFYTVRAVHEPKNAEKKQKRHSTKRYRSISRTCGGAPVQPIVIILGTARSPT